MNTTFPDTQPRPRFFFYVLVALVALMVIVVTANIGKMGYARVSLPSLSVQTVQEETKPDFALPVPVPVSAPPAVQSQATATPTPLMAAQPVPTPPVNQ